MQSIIPTNNLTVKQRKFIRALVRTGSPTEAAMQSYNCKDRQCASVIGRQNLVKLKITMNQLMDYMGLDEQRDLEDLKALREAKETKFFAHEGMVVDSKDVVAHDIRHKALELTLKMKGKLSVDKTIVDNSKHFHQHFTSLTDEQIINEARTRGIGIPASIIARAGIQSS